MRMPLEPGSANLMRLFAQRMMHYSKLKIPIWIAVWTLTRALMVVQVGFWLPDGAQYQDATLYHVWAEIILNTGAMPPDPTWQYPPGAAFFLLLPSIGGGTYEIEFMVLMLLLDLLALWLATRLAREEQRDVGVWVWLLAIPVLGAIPILRFDLVPTVAAIAGLIVIHRRPALVGMLAGVGAAIKVWPIFILFGEWDRARLLRSAAAALVCIVVICAASAVAFDDSFKFVTHQEGRGLQVESVAATAWKLREEITGKGQVVEARYGSNEIASGTADAIAKALGFATFAVLLGAAFWWWLRERAIRGGRSNLADVALSRDFVFTLTLWFVVVSRVLSPQYMIWLVGLAAIVLASRRTRLTRAAWIVVGATVSTVAIYNSPIDSVDYVFRNTALLYATLDASAVLSMLVLRPHAGPSRFARLARGHAQTPP